MAKKRVFVHYHIRWLPGDLLDWEPFPSAWAAEHRAKELVALSEMYTIEEFSSTCGRCQSREYSEPSKSSQKSEFVN